MAKPRGDDRWRREHQLTWVAGGAEHLCCADVDGCLARVTVSSIAVYINRRRRSCTSAMTGRHFVTFHSIGIGGFFPPGEGILDTLTKV